MAIKAGSILTDVNGFVVDRIQTGGPGSLNIPQERIYELGNWKSVAIVRDIPDLSFDLESFDTSAEFESLLVGKPGAAKAGYAAGTGGSNPYALDGRVGYNEVDFNNGIPIDVISPFKSRRNHYDIVKGVAIPYLTLERAMYRFGVGQNAMQQFSLKGDSIYYTPGQPYYEVVNYTGADTYSFSNGPAIEYDEVGTSVYALCVSVVSDTGTFRRLFTRSGDYTSTENGFTITSTGADKIESLDGTSYTLRVAYGSADTKIDYNPTNSGTNPNGNRIHEGTSVKPAAVRARDIDVYIGSTDATPTWTRMTGVQSAEATWAVQLDNDQEFGNRHYVLRDYFVPDVTGTIGLKPFDPADMWDKLAKITGVSTSNVIGADTVTPVPLEIRINHPDDGTRLKTIYIPDARFQVPGYSGRVQSKLETSLSFTSDQGDMYVYNGKRTNDN